MLCFRYSNHNLMLVLVSKYYEILYLLKKTPSKQCFLCVFLPFSLSLYLAHCHWSAPVWITLSRAQTTYIGSDLTLITVTLLVKLSSDNLGEVRDPLSHLKVGIIMGCSLARWLLLSSCSNKGPRLGSLHNTLLQSRKLSLCRCVFFSANALASNGWIWIDWIWMNHQKLGHWEIYYYYRLKCRFKREYS